MEQGSGVPASRCPMLYLSATGRMANQAVEVPDDRHVSEDPGSPP